MTGEFAERKLWSDSELSQAVEVYLLLLRLQLTEIEFRSEPLAQTLLSLRLGKRDQASIRYRMRNISAVIADFGQPVLRSFSPASRIGKGVRVRIEYLLLSNPSFKHLTNAGDKAPSPIGKLDKLRDAIEDIEQELIGIGHNGPPESISSNLDTEIFAEAKADVAALQRQLELPSPDIEAVAKHSAGLIEFAKKIAMWAGERLTVFVDAGLKVAAPVFVAKVTGLMPLVVSAVEAVTKSLAP
jgi:hypothetical protein